MIISKQLIYSDSIIHIQKILSCLRKSTSKQLLSTLHMYNYISPIGILHIKCEIQYYIQVNEVQNIVIFLLTVVVESRKWC